MLLRFEAAIGGKKFSDIAPEVLLRDIVEMPADMDVQTARRAAHYGQNVSSVTRTSLSVRLVYRIYAYDVERRAEVRDLIAEWARDGGVLTINTRPGKFLRVICETPPNVDSSLKWTQDLSMTLTAYTLPYWQEEETAGTAGQVSFQSTWSASHGMYYGANVVHPAGNLSSVPVEFYVVNNSTDNAPLTHLKIVVDDTFMEFSDLEVKPGLFGGWFAVEYNEHDLLVIHDLMSDKDYMANRTAESSDDLMARCGKDNQIHVYTDVPCTVTVTARGRWL